ncbi:MAG TPA: DUF3592 domain-containing protein [Pyrinomonadaceae bacterium]|nr:DUF3592 domain-containing protein [Pyrinomonadaceae bacterium]
MSLLSRFRRQKEDPELARRAALLRSGRVGDATVLGTDADADGIVTLSYNYTIGGVDYQSFQHLNAEQISRKHNYLPGARVQLRYDPYRPANSVVV